MRQMNETGWMHNRVRMVVAGFLSKDLLLDWRLGEAYFMEKLIDGDFSANNGGKYSLYRHHIYYLYYLVNHIGWQWAASTGTDSVPYFRVFNPLLQSQKFDSFGSYIKKWVPELKNLTGKSIHAPYCTLKAQDFVRLRFV